MPGFGSVFGFVPSVAVLKNTLGTVLGRTKIEIGRSADVEAPDATATLKDTDGNVISSTNIPSSTSEDLEAPNAVAILKTVGENIISETNILSGATAIITAPDATAVLKDTDGNTLSSTDIASGASANITAPDGAVLLNSVAVADVLSGGSVDIPVLQNGSPVGSLVSGEWIIPPNSCADATVEINGVEFDTVASGGTIDIPVIQDGAPVGSIVGSNFVIPSKPIFGAVRKTSSSVVNETTLSTGNWVLVVSADSGLISAGSEINCEYLGNLRWEVSQTGNYDYAINADLTHNETTSTTNAEITLGIWDGAEYVADDAIKQTIVLRSREYTVNNANAQIPLTFSNVALTAGGRVALMVKRLDTTRNMRIARLSQNIYKYVA
jgi:hypothetical protein